MSNIVITSSTNSNVNIKSNNIKASTTGKGDRGYSAYEIAQKNGFDGTEEEWLASLKGDNFEYDDFTEEQLKKLIGPTGPSNILTIGEVKKGNEAAATITGNSPNQILNLILPKGDKGDNPKSIDEQTGSRLTIEASEYNAKEFKIDGKSEQETSIEGINKFDDSVIIGTTLPTTAGTITTQFTIKNKLKNDTNYYTRLFINNQLWNGGRIAIQFYDSNNTQIGEIVRNSDVLNLSNLSTATYIKVYINASGVSEYGGQSITGLVISESDSTSYSEFVPNSPSPDYPSEIKTVKGIENLFDKDDVFLNKQWNGSTLSESEIANASPKIPVIGGKKYKRNVGYNANIFIKNDGSVVDIQGGTNTIVAPENSKYWVFNIPKEIDLNTVMAVQGDTISDYVPYGRWAKVKIENHKNIFNLKNIVVGYGLNSNNADTYSQSDRSYLDYTEIKANTYYTLNSITPRAIQFFDENKTFISSLSNVVEFTTPSNAKYVRIAFVNTDQYINAVIIDGKYEEYKENEALIDLSKPNLFKKEDFSYNANGYLNDNGVLQSSSLTVHTTMKIQVKPNTVYTIDGFEYVDLIKQSSIYKIYLFDENKNFISRYPSEGITTNKLTFTTPNNCYYIDFQFTRNENDYFINNNLETFRLYEGYEPYYELASIGDTKDKLEVVSGELTHKIGKVVLNGSENNWIYDAPKKRAVIQIVNSISTTYDNANFYCSHFKPLAKNYTTNNVVQYKDSYYFYIEEVATTLDEFKTWLSNNPVTVYYELATPETIELEKNNVSLFEGVNHITLVEDLETELYVKYYTMFKGNKGETEERDPIGTIKLYIGSKAPEGYLFCDGSEQSRNVYPELYDIIGTDYQVSTELFLVPNMTESRPTAIGTSSAITNYINYIIKAK